MKWRLPDMQFNAAVFLNGLEKDFDKGPLVPFKKLLCYIAPLRRFLSQLQDEKSLPDERKKLKFEVKPSLQDIEEVINFAIPINDWDMCLSKMTRGIELMKEDLPRIPPLSYKSVKEFRLRIVEFFTIFKNLLDISMGLEEVPEVLKENYERMFFAAHFTYYEILNGVAHYCRIYGKMPIKKTINENFEIANHRILEKKGLAEPKTFPYFWRPEYVESPTESSVYFLSSDLLKRESLLLPALPQSSHLKRRRNSHPKFDDEDLLLRLSKEIAAVQKIIQTGKNFEFDVPSKTEKTGKRTQKNYSERLQRQYQRSKDVSAETAKSTTSSSKPHQNKSDISHKALALSPYKPESEKNTSPSPAVRNSLSKGFEHSVEIHCKEIKALISNCLEECGVTIIEKVHVQEHLVDLKQKMRKNVEIKKIIDIFYEQFALSSTKMVRFWPVCENKKNTTDKLTEVLGQVYRLIKNLLKCTHATNKRKYIIDSVTNCLVEI